MVKFEGKYEQEKSENFVEYIRSMGEEITDEVAKKIRESKNVLTVELEGEQQYKFFNKTFASDQLLRFTIGKPFQEKLELQGTTLENIAKQEGNKIIISSVFNGKKNDRIYDFSDNGVIVTYQSPDTKIIGKEHFKRV